MLKSPKTHISIRRVYIPTTVAKMLLTLKQEQDELKEPNEPEPTTQDKSKQLLELLGQSPELAEILIKTLSAKNN